MKEEKANIVNKFMESKDECSPDNGNDMALINKFTKRKLSKDEVYIFSVVLCDNDIDRQNERFDDEALDKLSGLFVGKTGIMDHDCKSANQTARIFACEVQTSKDKQNTLGRPYKRLVAKAYMPRTEKNKEIISEIEAGIKKEVSINCSVENIICSLCGEKAKSGHCDHVKGRVYKRGQKDTLCHSILKNPIDAYEWSFVVVPAQKEAGVIKAFNAKHSGGESIMNNIIERLKGGENVSFDSNESFTLYEMVKALEEKAAIGDEYLNELRNDIMRLSKSAQPDITTKVMENVVSKMSLNELKAFREAYKKKSMKNIEIRPQLSRSVTKGPLNTQFKI